MHLFRILVPAATLLAVAVSCGDDDEDVAAPATSFSAVLSGTEEVPPVPTVATGSATFELTDAEISYTVEVANLENAVAAHIHIAPPGENGPVRMNLCGTGPPQPACASGDGVLATGTNGTTVGEPPITFDSLVSAMRSGGAYANVHTDDGEGEPNTGPGDMASGEIRGQISAD